MKTAWAILFWASVSAAVLWLGDSAYMLFRVWTADPASYLVAEGRLVLTGVTAFFALVPIMLLVVVIGLWRTAYRVG